MNFISMGGTVIRSRAAYVEQQLVEEELHAVASARVLFANYDLIVQDFPQFEGVEPAAIDAWLLDNAAIASAAQVANAEVNTPIAVTSRTVRAFRPPRYGRAVVVETPEGCLLDVKGVGVAPGVAPQHHRHRTGLLALPRALYEVLFEWLTSAALLLNNSNHSVVPSYGLIDLGFDVFDPEEGRHRACVLVRRAHTRPRIQWGTEDPGPVVAGLLRDVVLELRRSGLDATVAMWELIRRGDTMVLSAYGTDHIFRDAEATRVAALTRCDESTAFEAVNVQFTTAMRENPPRVEIVDFGGFRPRHRFHAPLFSPTVARYVALVGDMTFPDDSRYVHAAARRMPSASADHRLVRVLTHAYERGECDGITVQRKLQELVWEAFALPKTT